jgi:hypothetical protein
VCTGRARSREPVVLIIASYSEFDWLVHVGALIDIESYHRVVVGPSLHT